MLLTDTRGNTWTAAQVGICQGGFGFDSEGVEKLPRPSLYDATGEVELVQGDRLIIDFINGNSHRPFVRGGVRSLAATDLAPNHAASGASVNRLRLRVVPRDPTTGLELGTVQIDVSGDDQASVLASIGSWLAVYSGGTMHLETGDALTMQAGGPVLLTATEGTSTLQGPLGHVSEVGADGVMTVSRGVNSAEKTIRGETFLAELMEAISECAGNFAGLGLPFTNCTIFVANVGLAAGPDGYLSDTLKVG